MRFELGSRYHERRGPRGRGRHDPPYRMSEKAYRTRIRNLGSVQRERSSIETRHIEAEIAPSTFRWEPYRPLAKRLGLRSYKYVWRVARRCRMEMILNRPPLSEAGLRGVLDTLASPPEPTP